ncbi:MAG: PEGA domain-containing protein [Bryobacteraceae bacterium]
METRVCVAALLMVALGASDLAVCAGLNLDDRRKLVFSPAGGEELTIPYKRIRSMEYGQKDHSLTIRYGNAVAVVTVAEDSVRSTLALLTMRTGKRVELKREEQGAEFAKLAFATRPPKPVRAAVREERKEIAVRFTSVPDGADVLINDEFWGSTPTVALTRLEAGTYKVVVKKSGYVRWEENVTLAPGDDRTVAAELAVQPYDPMQARITGNF